MPDEVDLSELRSGLPRAVEVLMAALGLAALWPLFVLIAVAVRLSSTGPVFFRQQRVGRHGRPFELIKFRTMTVGSGARVTAAGDQRVTRVGRALRASKLDELPELLNILRGDMSFVGPRPEVPALADLEDARWRFVLQARPGLTDPVTLRLRNEEQLLAALVERLGGELETIYREHLQPWKLRGYADYLCRRSAWSDIDLVVQTLLALVLRERAQAPDVEEILSSHA